MAFNTYGVCVDLEFWLPCVCLVIGSGDLLVWCRIKELECDLVECVLLEFGC